MLTDDERGRIAQELETAARDRRPVRPASARYPAMTMEDAYAVQSIWSDAKRSSGMRIVGHKVGLTSRVMQRSVGIDEPDYGVIFEDQVYESGDTIPFHAFSSVRIETELAFVLAEPLSGGRVSMYDVLDATSYVVPALEVLDTRFELDGRTIVDNIADNAALGAVVIGTSPARPSEVDPAWVCALLRRNGRTEDSGVAGSVLGHPAKAVAWLVNKLDQHGQHLEAGELILSGSFTRPMSVEAEDVILAEYRDLGNVVCRFT